MKTIFIEEFGPYFVNCYYCGKEVTEETHGWNASKDGELWLCHASCMEREEREILRTGNVERGEIYSEIHILTNPATRKSREPLTFTRPKRKKFKLLLLLL